MDNYISEKIKGKTDFFFDPRLEYMFGLSLKLSRHIPKRFDAFQVLK